MRKIILLIAACLLLGNIAFAQASPAPLTLQQAVPELVWTIPLESPPKARTPVLPGVVGVA